MNSRGMWGEKDWSKDSKKSFVSSLRRLSGSLIRFLFRGDKWGSRETSAAEAAKPEKKYSFLPDDTNEAFYVDDMEAWHELLHEDSRDKTDSALQFFSPLMSANENDPESFWTTDWSSDNSRNVRPQVIFTKRVLYFDWKTYFKKRRVMQEPEKEASIPWFANFGS